MAKAPIVRRGKTYFCSECNHLMGATHEKCPQCGTQFDGVVEEEARKDAPIQELDALEHDYEEEHEHRTFWLGLAAIVLVGVVAIGVVLVLTRR